MRSGGIGLGLWGGVGTLVLVFVFGLDPGEPPISAMLIIIAVIAAAAAMQAAGGIDYMVLIASKALRARPKALNFAAPYVSYLLTILTGTGNTFFSLIPVINELAYANKIRPERALAGSTVASTFGITASPVAAAMATMLPLVEIYDYDIVDVMLITVPASIIGIFAMALVHEHATARTWTTTSSTSAALQPARSSLRHPPVRSRCCPTRSAASRSSSRPSPRSASSASSRASGRRWPRRAAASSRCP